MILGPHADIPFEFILSWRSSINTMELRINTLGGSLCTLCTQPTWTVRDIKSSIEAKAGINADQQRLLLVARELEDGEVMPSAAHPLDITLVLRPAEQAAWLLKAKEDYSVLVTPEAEAAWGDREIVLAACHQSGWALKHAAPELQADREVALVAVRKQGMALQHVAAELAADSEVVLSAVEECGRALCHAAAELRMQRAFVLAAVRANWRALEHCEDCFRSDREIVLAAVSQSGRALGGAARELREDFEVVAAAIHASEHGHLALSFAEPALRQDPELRAVAKEVAAQALTSGGRQRQFRRRATR